VPVVLNMISPCESAENAAAIFAAAKPRLRYGLGASGLVTATTPASARVAVSARPCTDAAVPAAHVILAAAGLDVSKQLVSEQPVFMTRTSAAGGGALGPHTAREPV
jgi:hypothetical protein